MYNIREISYDLVGAGKSRLLVNIPYQVVRNFRASGILGENAGVMLTFEERFTRLYEQNFTMALGYCHRRLKLYGTIAEDAVHEAFKEFWEKQTIPPRGELFLRVRSRAIDALRRGNRLVSIEEVEPDISTLSDDAARVGEFAGLWNDYLFDFQHILTDREQEVLNLVVDGLASKEIAGQLSISAGRVSQLRKSIINKLTREAERISQREQEEHRSVSKGKESKAKISIPIRTVNRAHYEPPALAAALESRFGTSEVVAVSPTGKLAGVLVQYFQADNAQPEVVWNYLAYSRAIYRRQFSLQKLTKPL